MNANFYPLQFLKQLLIYLLLLFISVNAFASDKKGIGLADLDGAARIKALNVNWYYTWSPNPIKGITSAKFVPMLRSRGGRLLDEQIAFFRSQGKIPELLVLNEPNMPKADNMSVEEVINIWPDISTLSDKIISPGVNALSPWMDKFYRMAINRNYQIDYIAVHYYSASDAKSFLSRIDEVYQKYHLPIWITEFAVADYSSSKRNCRKDCQNQYTPEYVLNFMKEVLPELEKRPYVVRYAWFGAGKTSLEQKQVSTSTLFDKDGKLTQLGQFYANFQ